MNTQRSKVATARRGLFVALGATSVGLGTLGIVVPGLPTTVFLLLASYFFARSSPRLHRRLLEHSRLGPYLEMAMGRAMPLRAKVVSLAAMWAGISVSCFALAGTSAAAQLAVVSMGLVGTAVLLLWVRTPSTEALLFEKGRSEASGRENLSYGGSHANRLPVDPGRFTGFRGTKTCRISMHG